MLMSIYGDFTAAYRFDHVVSTSADEKDRKVAVNSPCAPRARSVVLVGLMGVGKSSIGRRLASRLGIPFVDADAEIEEAAGSTVPEIFARHGEAEFRDGERRVIARLLDGPRHVLATGGGAFLDSGTRSKVAETATSVWLRADLDLLVKRCARRRNRPLLEEGDPREILAKLIEERYPVYAKADIVVDSVDGPHEAVVDKILDALSGNDAAEPTP